MYEEARNFLKMNKKWLISPQSMLEIIKTITVLYQSIFFLSSLWDRPIHEQYFSENLWDKRVIKNPPPSILPFEIPVNICKRWTAGSVCIQRLWRYSSVSASFETPNYTSIASPDIRWLVWFKTCSLKFILSACTLNITRFSLRQEFGRV